MPLLAINAKTLFYLLPFSLLYGDILLFLELEQSLCFDKLLRVALSCLAGLRFLLGDSLRYFLGLGDLESSLLLLELARLCREMDLPGDVRAGLLSSLLMVFTFTLANSFRKPLPVNQTKCQNTKKTLEKRLT